MITGTGNGRHGKPGRPRLSAATRDEIIRLRDRGWTLDRIADAVGRSVSAVRRTINRADYAAAHGIPETEVRDCARCKEPSHGPVRLCARHGGAA